MMRKVRAADAKEVGVKNPAEETSRNPDRDEVRKGVPSVNAAMTKTGPGLQRSDHGWDVEALGCRASVAWQRNGYARGTPSWRTSV